MRTRVLQTFCQKMQFSLYKIQDGSRLIFIMTVPLKPNPANPMTVTTAMSEPIFADKKQIAKIFDVSQRTIDYWREQGLLPYLRIGGTIRFDIEQCREAVLKHCQGEPGELWAGNGRRRWKRESSKGEGESPQSELL